MYVTKDANAAEADRMVPLSMARDLATGEFVWQGNYLVNPWAEDGSLVALDDYPRMAAYLSASQPCANASLRGRLLGLGIGPSTS